MADVINVLNPELRSVIRKEVPFIPGAWADFYDDMTIGAIKKAQSVQDTKSFDSGLDLVLSQIADWNFADQQQVKLPITADSLDLLSSKLLTWLAEAQGELLDGQEAKKKDSPSL